MTDQMGSRKRKLMSIIDFILDEDDDGDSNDVLMVTTAMLSYTSNKRLVEAAFMLVVKLLYICIVLSPNNI